MMFLWEPTCVNLIHEYEFLQKKSRTLRYMLGHEKLKCRIQPMLGLASINEKNLRNQFWQKYQCLDIKQSQKLQKFRCKGGSTFKVVLEFLKKCYEPILVHIYSIHCHFINRFAKNTQILKIADFTRWAPGVKKNIYVDIKT